jgi:hypothetical protein
MTTDPCDSMSIVAEVPLSQMLGRLLAGAVETEMSLLTCQCIQLPRTPISVIDSVLARTNAMAVPVDAEWRHTSC